jgi:hypothetical protein
MYRIKAFTSENNGLVSNLKTFQVKTVEYD